MRKLYKMLDPSYGEWELLYEAENGQVLLKNTLTGTIRSCYLQNYKLIRIEFINEATPQNYSDKLSYL